MFLITCNEYNIIHLELKMRSREFDCFHYLLFPIIYNFLFIWLLFYIYEGQSNSMLQVYTKQCKNKIKKMFTMQLD